MLKQQALKLKSKGLIDIFIFFFVIISASLTAVAMQNLEPLFDLKVDRFVRVKTVVEDTFICNNNRILDLTLTWYNIIQRMY